MAVGAPVFSSFKPTPKNGAWVAGDSSPASWGISTVFSTSHIPLSSAQAPLSRCTPSTGALGVTGVQLPAGGGGGRVGRNGHRTSAPGTDTFTPRRASAGPLRTSGRSPGAPAPDPSGAETPRRRPHPAGVGGGLLSAHPRPRISFTRPLPPGLFPSGTPCDDVKGSARIPPAATWRQALSKKVVAHRARAAPTSRNLGLPSASSPPHHRCSGSGGGGPGARARRGGARAGGEALAAPGLSGHPTPDATRGTTAPHPVPSGPAAPPAEKAWPKLPAPPPSRHGRALLPARGPSPGPPRPPPPLDLLRGGRARRAGTEGGGQPSPAVWGQSSAQLRPGGRGEGGPGAHVRSQDTEAHGPLLRGQGGREADPLACRPGGLYLGPAWEPSRSSGVGLSRVLGWTTPSTPHTCLSARPWHPPARDQRPEARPGEAHVSWERWPRATLVLGLGRDDLGQRPLPTAELLPHEESMEGSRPSPHTAAWTPLKGHEASRSPGGQLGTHCSSGNQLRWGRAWQSGR
nr:nascent polypeptide-associated complex subunit alpha, muscle-specific form-like [Camelus dromedarius]